jgi:hypothetical protein
VELRQHLLNILLLLEVQAAVGIWAAVAAVAADIEHLLLFLLQQQLLIQ